MTRPATSSLPLKIETSTKRVAIHGSKTKRHFVSILQNPAGSLTGKISHGSPEKTQILGWSTALLVGRLFEQLADDGRHETLLGYRSALHGSGPEVFAGASETAELDALVVRVRGWLDSGIAPGEIGISARFNKVCDKAVKRLEAAGIRAARLRGDTFADQGDVQIGTMHAFKGPEFRCVAVIGVSEEPCRIRKRSPLPMSTGCSTTRISWRNAACCSSRAPGRGTACMCRGRVSRVSSWWRPGCEVGALGRPAGLSDRRSTVHAWT